MSTLLQDLRARVRPQEETGLYSVQGSLRGRQEARMLFVGRASRMREASRLFFHGATTVTPLGPLEGVRYARLARAPSGHELRVWEARPGQTSQPGGPYVMQPWLDARVRPGPDPEAFLASQVSKSTLRHLRKAATRGLAVTRSRTRADLDVFFHQLLQPTLEARWGEDLMPPSLEKLHAWNGRTSHVEIVFLERDGRRIAGSALVVSALRGELTLWGTGATREVLEDPNLRSEFTPLLYAELARIASGQDLELNLSLTRPFLDDGPFRAKRRWACHLEPIPCFSRFAVEFDPVTRLQVLQAAPLFHLPADGVSALVALEEGEHGPKRLGALLSEAAFDGLRSIQVGTGASNWDSREAARLLPPSAASVPIRVVAA